MKILIEDSIEIQLFQTKEEWDRHSMSWAGWKKNRKEGTYQERFMNEPYKFPCLLIQGTLTSNPNGPDEYANSFLYDFIVENDDD